MATDYEQLYRTTANALGAPTQIFVDVFASLSDRRLRVLDVGCGQGRDALFIARAGHSVLGVDLSPSGIRDLTAAARTEGLNVTGVVADITDYTPQGTFDVIVIDRTLHILDGASRLAVFARLLDHVAAGGWCLVVDEPRNIAALKRVAESHDATWDITKDTRGDLFLRKPPG